MRTHKAGATGTEKRIDAYREIAILKLARQEAQDANDTDAVVMFDALIINAEKRTHRIE